MAFDGEVVARAKGGESVVPRAGDAPVRSGTVDPGMADAPSALTRWGIHRIGGGFGSGARMRSVVSVGNRRLRAKRLRLSQPHVL